MNNIDINCDVGEGIGNEHAMMPFIQCCNIACGGHAGNNRSMTEIVLLAIKHKVKIGAHPSYPDLENFGRKSIKLSIDELAQSLLHQIETLREIVVNYGGKLNHIKAHGALYNDLMTNEELSFEFLDIVAPYKNDVKLFLSDRSIVANIAIKKGFTVVYEAFADRNYNDDLSLVSRKEKNAVITNPKTILKRVLEIKNNGTITSISGLKIPILAGTICLHSDTANIIESLKYLNQNLNFKGTTTNLMGNK